MGSVVSGRRWDHAFFGAMAAAIAVAVFIGFEQSYFRAGLFFAHLPSLMVHIHGALFVGWVLLLGVQIALVASGHTRWHRQLGVLGAVMAPLMVIAGLTTLVLAMRRNAVPRIPLSVFFAGDLLQLVAFAILVTWALRRRKEPAAHKRLMLFATIAILAPAIDRWPFAFMTSIAMTTAILTLFPLAIAAYDLATTRRVHWATRWGWALYVLMLAGIFTLPALPPWRALTAWVIAG
jgi:hypothetical protein